MDDGFALAFAVKRIQAHSNHLELVGVSAVAGNTDAATAQGCADSLLERLGTKVRCTPQAKAAQAIARVSTNAASQDSLRILALGPLTNVAAALALHPPLAGQAECTTVGGVAQPWRSPLLRFSCLNFRHNPAAAMAVTRAPWRRRLGCPLDVVKRLRMDAEGLNDLASRGDLGAYLAEHSWRWLRQAPLRHARFSFPVWDLTAVMAALDALPGAIYNTDRSRLLDFDPALARTAFADCIGGRAHPKD